MIKAKLRVLILAAGKGTRLRPITNSIPKCLVSVNGIAMLERWIQIIEKENLDEVIINTHYLAEQVREFIHNKYMDLENKRIKLIHEDELLGTAGSIYLHRSWFRGFEGLIIHADNYYEGNLDYILEAHRKRPNGCLITMVTFECNDSKACGLVDVDDNKIVRDFKEKDPDAQGNIANAAIYAFSEEFIDWLDKNGEGLVDMSTDVIPRLIGRIYTVPTNHRIVDIGTPERLQEVEWTGNQK